MKLNYGKYKGIIISVALFLLLDASVLIMNFYISFEIADDAEGVNIAGRQRMLSQSMMKSLLDFQSSDDFELQNSSVTELQSTIDLFDKTLNAFALGGETKSANGLPIYISAVDTPAGITVVKNTQSVWQPFNKQLNLMVDTYNRGDKESLESQILQATVYGREHNLTLLRLMNKLTVELESVAASKANTLRIIQTVGISLAVLNFFIIMFHFLRQLRESDEKIDSARKETQEILDTVNEGLFLLDKDQKIGSQYSDHLTDILGQTEISGKPFEQLLKGMVSEKDRDTAKSYIKLLFDPKKKQKLLGDLNPLRQIQVHIPHQDGSYETKHLNFSFSRVVKNKKIFHVLVTVLDISKQVELALEVENMRNQGQEQLELLSAILQCNPDLLKTFLDNSYKTFNQINQTLKAQTKDSAQYLSKANKIYALVHNYKGEAAALDLQQFVNTAHDFEEHIQSLKNQSEIQGNDFLTLAVQLNRLISQTESTHKLVEKVSSLSGELDPLKEHKRYQWQHYHNLANDVAQRQGKRVEVVCSGFNDYPLQDDLAASINTIIVHMIRNAVSHGIEIPRMRELAQKPISGEIHVRLVKRINGDYQLSIEDDGHGIDSDRIRNKAIDQGIITVQQAENLDSKKTAALIFHPDLSTTDTADTDSGRGIGMFAIREMVKRLSGKLTISSKKNLGTSFVITIPDSINSVDEAA